MMSLVKKQTSKVPQNDFLLDVLELVEIPGLLLIEKRICRFFNGILFADDFVLLFVIFCVAFLICKLEIKKLNNLFENFE